MKLITRNISFVALLVCATQLFFSCSSNKLQSNVGHNTDLGIAQNQNATQTREMVTRAPQSSTVLAENRAIEAVTAPLAIKELASASAGTEKFVVKNNSVKNTFGEHAKAGNELKKNTKLQFKKLNKITGAASPMAGGKSQIVAALLAFFLGYIGIHRFYLGYTWQGIVQILTLGGCGIWALVDFIRILLGDLQPKDSSYTSTLDDL